MEVAEREPNDSLIASFSNHRFGLTANVRKSGNDLEIVIIDTLSGEEVLSTGRQAQEEAEQFASELMNPSSRSIAARLQSGVGWA